MHMLALFLRIASMIPARQYAQRAPTHTDTAYAKPQGTNPAAVFSVGALIPSLLHLRGAPFLHVSRVASYSCPCGRSPRAGARPQRAVVGQAATAALAQWLLADVRLRPRRRCVGGGEKFRGHCAGAWCAAAQRSELEYRATLSKAVRWRRISEVGCRRTAGPPFQFLSIVDSRPKLSTEMQGAHKKKQHVSDTNIVQSYREEAHPFQ